MKKESDIDVPENPEEKPEENPEKMILWDQKRKETDEIKDDLNLGIDEGIKEAVTAFRIYEFPTSQSCEGHLNGKNGEPFPWVQIYAKQPKEWKDSEGQEKEELEKNWTIENLKQQQKMMNCLAEFYEGRETSFDARLVFSNIGAFGGFRVQSFGAETMKLLSPEEQGGKLRLYRKEMDAFANYLKSKFLGQ